MIIYKKPVEFFFIINIVNPLITYNPHPRALVRMSFSYIHLDSAAQLPYAVARVASDCLTESKDRVYEKLRQELLLEGWASGPNPWDPTYQLDSAGTDTLSAAKARIAAKKVRFTVLEETAPAKVHIAAKKVRFTVFEETAPAKALAKAPTEKGRLAFNKALEATLAVKADNASIGKMADKLKDMRQYELISNTQYADLMEILCAKLRKV